MEFLKENNMMKIRTLQFMILPLALLSVHSGCTKEDSGKNHLIDFRDAHSIKSQKPILIAHRGGVITAQSPECSIAAIRLAKQHGYAMVELDIRKSKDHVPIVFHDNDLKKACGLNKRLERGRDRQYCLCEHRPDDLHVRPGLADLLFIETWTHAGRKNYER
jgi:glycerophosphoryl diester phosphodiesterase